MSKWFDGNGIDGIRACIAPKKLIAAYIEGRKVKTVDLKSLEEKTLLEDFGIEYIDGTLSIDPEEEHVLLPLMPGHPDILAGKKHARTYLEAFKDGGMFVKYIELPLDGSKPGEKPKTLLLDDGVGCAHCPHNPEDSDLILVDRDRAPYFWCGGDRKAPRCWTYQVSTKQFTPIVAQCEQKFMAHAGWTWDGEKVFYHGRLVEGKGDEAGWYVGLTDKFGNPFREYHFTDAKYYGHVSAAPDRPALMLDGNLTRDLLLWVYYDKQNPKIEVIAKHGTEWKTMPGQYTDPHPQTDRSGKWIVFNSCKNMRSDIFIVEV